MLEKKNSAGPTARLKNLRFEKRLPGISRKYKYGVCVLKISCAVFRPQGSRRASINPTDRLEPTCSDLTIERLSFFERSSHAATAKTTDAESGG
jgi:hypothetical protein